MGMLKKITTLILLFMWLGALPAGSWGSGVALGKQAPNFRVESGDNQTLSLDMVRGKVVVLFYESRNVIRKNIELKNELKRSYLAQPANIKKDIFRLVVIDCSEAFWPTTPIWKSKLQEHSRKEGFTIYGDWNRTMLEAYRMKPEESNFLIIDKQGVIRYSAASRVENGQIEGIKDLLSSLVKE